MLTIVFFNFNCNRITVILAKSSGIPLFPPVRLTSLKQYTIIIVIIAGGRYLPKYIIISGGFSPLPKIIKGASLVPKVMAAIISIEITSLPVVIFFNPLSQNY